MWLQYLQARSAEEAAAMHDHVLLADFAAHFPNFAASSCPQDTSSAEINNGPSLLSAALQSEQVPVNAQPLQRPQDKSSAETNNGSSLLTAALQSEQVPVNVQPLPQPAAAPALDMMGSASVDNSRALLQGLHCPAGAQPLQRPDPAQGLDNGGNGRMLAGRALR